MDRKINRRIEILFSFTGIEIDRLLKWKELNVRLNLNVRRNFKLLYMIDDHILYIIIFKSYNSQNVLYVRGTSLR